MQVSHVRPALTLFQADVVLHDGAPNVGKAWVQDAYGQVIVIVAMSTATLDLFRRASLFCTRCVWPQSS